jgi:SsrA-binding protein
MADIVTNHKARRDYHILDTFEAGIVLHGTEVKSLRAGKGQIADAFARVEKDEVWLYNAHIDEYSHGNIQNHAIKAPRKLLLHKSEIRKLFRSGGGEGQCAVPAVVLLEERQGESLAWPLARASRRSTSARTSRSAMPTVNWPR